MSMIDAFVRKAASKDQVVLTADCPTVWVTRDSVARGALLEYCDLWIERPVRVHHPEAGGSSHWINPDSVALDQCYLGSYTLAAVRAYIGTIPETDRECITIPRSK